MNLYIPKLYRHRQTEVEGLPHDGTGGCAAAIGIWSHGQFTVDHTGELRALSPDGPRYVRPGDTAMIGVMGEPYPVRAEVMERSYDLANGRDYTVSLTTHRLLELQARAQGESDPTKLREILAAVVASHLVRPPE